MMLDCAKSCATCGMDETEFARTRNQRALLYDVGGDERLLETPYGMAQEQADADAQAVVKEVIANYTKYMETTIMADPKSTVKTTCKNRHAKCAVWTAMGKCKSVCTIANSMLLCAAGGKSVFVGKQLIMTLTHPLLLPRHVCRFCY